MAGEQHRTLLSAVADNSLMIRVDVLVCSHSAEPIGSLAD